MRKLIIVILAVAAVAVFPAPSIAAAQITEIIDSTGDGAGNTLNGPSRIAVDGNGNVYVSGRDSDNAFKITSGGVIAEIIDSTGDGAGNVLWSPMDIAVDGSGNVYVAGHDSDNAFKITSGGVITEIIDITGDGAGNTLSSPYGIAVDGNGNVYVTGWATDNAFKTTPLLAVGGVAELPQVAVAPLETQDSSGRNTLLFAVVAAGAGLATLGGAGWWARRRWLR